MMARGRRGVALIAAVALVSLLSVAHGEKAADAVVVVDGQESFDKLLKDNAFVAAEFYAPWCGHCKKLKPEWATASNELEKLADPKITLAAIDCTTEANKPLATKFNVQGFPTIKIFRDGDSASSTEYDGPREAKGIVSYLKKQAGPASSLLKDAAAVKEFRTFDEDKDTVVVAVFPSGAEGNDFKAYSSVADSLRSDYDFGHVTDASLLAEGKDAKKPTVVLLKEDGPAETFDEAFTVEGVKAWVEKKAAPVLISLDQKPGNRKALQKVFASDQPKVLGFAAKGSSELKGVKEALIAASKDESINVIFAESGENSGAMEYFGIKASDVPAFVIHAPENNDAKYTSKNAKPESLAKWLEEFKAGKLERAVKSEEAPEKNDGPVKILTAKTFDDLVFGKPAHNTFIEFYAPWCGHCKKLSPIWDKLGAAFKDNDSVVIAKLDATANDVPDPKKFKVNGFPTLKFVKADGEVLDYEGDRSETHLLEFVNSHAGSKATYATDEL